MATESRPTVSGNSITMENEIVDAEARRLELKRLERIVMKMSDNSGTKCKSGAGKQCTQQFL
jgi:hypothetical protein